MKVKDEQLGPNSAPGITTAIGRSGRGKTTTWGKIATVDDRVAYVSYAGWLSHTGIIREICFSVAGARPRSAQACFELLERSLAEKQRMILVDESDRMSLKHLNVLRDLHDRCAVPIVLIGEELLRSKLAQERRLVSRICHEVIFEEVGRSDVALFYLRSLDLELSPRMASDLAKLLEKCFAVSTAAALSNVQLSAFIAAVRNRGWKPKQRPGEVDEQVLVFRRRIKSLADQIPNGEERLRGLCQLFCGKESVNWCTDIPKMKRLWAALGNILRQERQMASAS
jgi:hypothetical protein